MGTELPAYMGPPHGKTDGHTCPTGRGALCPGAVVPEKLCRLNLVLVLGLGLPADSVLVANPWVTLLKQQLRADKETI